MVSETQVSWGHITVETRDPAVCRYHVSWWDALTPAEKMREADHLPAGDVIETPNTTCIQLHHWTVDGLDDSQPMPSSISGLAVGRSSTQPEESDTGLTDEVDRVSVTEFTDSGSTLDARTFLGEGDGNVDVGAGESLSEVGLYAGSYFLNHSVLAQDIEKDATVTATITVSLSFTAQ